jgi:hypothetical protein
LKPLLQEATLAVSETDRKKRERKKRQSLHNKGTEGNALKKPLTCLLDFNLLLLISWVF